MQKNSHIYSKSRPVMLDIKKVNAIAQKIESREATNRILEMIFHLLGGFFSTILVG